MKKTTILFLFFCSLIQLKAQDSIPGQKSIPGRKWLATGVSLAGYAGSLVVLNEAWYKNYPKSSFHSFNDGSEWLQVDKTGHAWTAYNLGRASTAMWKWAGYDEEKYDKAVWLGSLSGFTYLTVIEVLDAHSANWGWSWADMGANAFGTALFASQELGWREQKIQFKFSSFPFHYSKELQPRADELFGKSFQEKLLKDYNAQTYWLSFNLNSFAKTSRLPKWLNFSIGYGARNLYGGFENRSYDENGNLVFDRTDIPRRRQWYISPDIDLTKIRTNSKLLRTVFFCFNSLKLPAPALEFTAGRLRFHPLYY